MPAKTLSVLPNPYLSFDHEGRPNHHVPWDPDHNPDRGWVGAHLCAVVHKRDAQGFATHQDTFVEFDLDTPTMLPATHYYLAHLRSGELIPADEATSKQIGRPFVDPKTVLADAKAKLADRWAAHYPDEDAPTLDVHPIGTHAAKLEAEKKEAAGQAKATEVPASQAAVPTTHDDAPHDLTPKPGLVALAPPIVPDPVAAPAGGAS